LTVLAQHSSGITTTVIRQLDHLAQDHALLLLAAALVAARHLGHHRLTLLHREPHPYLQLAVAGGGKSHLIFEYFFI
jgi:hypothetical protein